MAYTEKVVINSKYAQPKIKEFIKNLPKFFKSNGTTVYKARNTIKTFDIDEITINVKSFKKPHIINQFAYAVLRDSKAKRSYRYAKKLIDLGIDTPAPIAYLEFRKFCFFKHSFYISEHIEIDDEMRVIQKGTLEQHRALIEQFAYFTAELHKAQVLHLDYSPGNILFKKDKDSYSFYLVDLNRMKFDREISVEEAAHNFRRLWGSDQMIQFFVEEYAKHRDMNVDKAISLTFRERKKFWKTFQKKYPNATPYIASILP